MPKRPISKTTTRKPATVAKPKTSAKRARTRAAGVEQARPRKADQIFAMIERLEGASIDEIAKKFGIKPHSARAVISVESRKRGVKSVLNNGRYKVAVPGE